MKVLEKVFGNDTTAALKRFKKTLILTNELESSVVVLADTDFPIKTRELKERLATGATIESLIPEAFALVREAARRAIGLRHYDVQILGGMALTERAIAEMKTGEGKTLVATLPVYLRALEGKGVHVVTVNDYLARRDAVIMGDVYHFLGLTLGVLNDENKTYLYDASHTEKDKERDSEGFVHVVHEFLRPCSRKDAYDADITYGTNSQYGFDYLRDNLATSIDQIVQRGHHYALVDEVDSILIDEARTPLIISSATRDSEDFYRQFAEIARSFVKETDYLVDEKDRAIRLTNAGIAKAESLLNIENIYTEKGIKYVHHLETAVKAMALFMRDREYVVRDGEVIIVDPFTGRMQPGRRWSEGLHQAVEAKEGVTVREESRAVASITYQNYFKLYTHLSGMTGTADTSKEEFRKVYNLSVVVIPTNKPSRRIDHTDMIFQTEQGKYSAIAKKIRALHEKGQPVLVGTISIEQNELLAAYLAGEGIPHVLLNAKNNEREGTLIADAGKRGAVTIATNMAGRGVDIKLGGEHASVEEADEVRALGGLFVLGSERHEARRIDNQLRGRAGRQGDPGETQFFVSLEDDLMRIFGGDRVKSMMGKLGVEEDMPIQNGFIASSLESAQTRIEGFHFDSRRYTLEYDTVLSHQRSIIYTRRHAALFADREWIAAFVTEMSGYIPEFAEIYTEKVTRFGEEEVITILRRIILHATDMLWTEHLETMEYLRGSVNLRAYGQREPLVEYKREGLRLFREMEHAFRTQVFELIRTIETASVPQEEHSIEIKPITEEFKGVGRNDACPCGSGKKFKKCHGANSA